MNNLPTFIHNETKTFKFTNEQYYYLEIEYNRYLIYKSLIKQIEKILNITESINYTSINNNTNNRKKYENKNILDRFVLECINHGLTPQIECEVVKSENATLFQDNYLEDNRDVNYEFLSHNLLFNKIIENTEKLHKTSYYKKMLNEYNEKKIRLTPDKIIAIDNAIANSNKFFSNQCKFDLNCNINTNKNIINIKFKNINCSITLQNNEYFIIKYRDYIKTISISRYYKIIKNYDKPYPYDIIRMLLRYSIFDMSSQQWSIGDNLYEDISEIFNISFEMFASPLNFNMNTFCSVFYDTDNIFGSVGSFYKLGLDKLLNQNIKGVFFNPPYLPLLMKKCTIQCLNIINEMNKLQVDFTIVSFLPHWGDADYIKNFIGSEYTVDYKIVNKGNYILHEKDRGKLINGTFDLLVIVLNSMKANWSDEKKLEIEKDIIKIVTIMNLEAKEMFIKKK